MHFNKADLSGNFMFYKSFNQIFYQQRTISKQQQKKRKRLFKNICAILDITTKS